MSKAKEIPDGSTNIGEIYELAHKINTPLSTINGYAAVIEKLFNGKNIITNEDHEKLILCLDKIKSEVNKIAGYTEKIQNYTK